MYNIFNKVLGICIRNIFLLLGPIYIKLGQVMSYDYPILKELYTLQDNCGSLPRKYLCNIKESYPELSIEDNYLSSGSVAVVHKCYYNGMNCVVKIKRPNIDKTIEKNINQINWLLNVFLKIFINLKCIDISGKLKKALSLYRIQSDFINEVENWKKYDKIFSNIEGILIPKVVEEVSNNDIIVMEYISGKNLIKDVNCFKDNLKLLYTIDNKFMGIFITSMLNNIYHGDLHMGNFSFTEKGDIIIYDFGICFDFNESDPNDNFLMDIMDSIYTRNKDDTISIIINGYADLNDDDKSDLIKSLINSDECKELFDKIYSREFMFYDVFKCIKHMLKIHNIKLNDRLLKTEFVFVSLVPSFDHIRNIYRIYDFPPRLFNDTIINYLI